MALKSTNKDWTLQPQLEKYTTEDKHYHSNKHDPNQKTPTFSGANFGSMETLQRSSLQNDF